MTTALNLFVRVLCVVGAGFLSAPAIKALHDFAVGPNPGRFGLVANIAMDSVIVLVLDAIMSTVDWGLGRFGLKQATN